MLAKLAAFAMILLPTAAAEAAICIVDPETLEIRDHLIATDGAYLVTDQTGATLQWVINAEHITDHGQRYEKLGAPRTFTISDIELQGFIGALPLFKAKGEPEVPDVVYLLVDPKECRVQPYRKAP